MPTRIQKNLRYLRENINQSKTWVGQQLGKNPNSIGDYEKGKVNPPVTVLEQYAEVFGVYIGDIVGKDLWNGELVEDRKSDDTDRRIQREKDLLHSHLDGLEAKMSVMRAEVLRLARKLAADSGAEEYHEMASKILKKLDEG